MSEKEYNFSHAKPSRQTTAKREKSATAEDIFYNEYQDQYSQEQKAGIFSFDTIHGLQLKEVDYTVQSQDARGATRREFNGPRSVEEREKNSEPGMRAKFLRHLADNRRDELKEKLGLSDEEINLMAKKGYAPKGYNVHHKFALHGGGKNEFSNLILVPNYPHDQWHKDVMDPQLIGIQEGETRKIMIPWTDEMIYDPKKYGFTKDNQKVEPNYSSVVNEDNYPKIHLPEHIGSSKRQKEIVAFYQKQAVEKKKEAAKASGEVPLSALMAQVRKVR